MPEMMIVTKMRGVCVVLLVATLVCCGPKGNHDATGSDSFEDSDSLSIEDYEMYENSVLGHNEQDTITGNFTGLGIDTMFVVEEVPADIHDLEAYKFYAKSNNRNLPAVELYGYAGAHPKLVYEGDVDGDGKDEWGYLHTWITSQWRQYRIYNYDSGKKVWRHLYYDDVNDNKGIYLLDTGEALRSSGLDIVEKGPKPGLIKINYYTNYPTFEFRDTIVKPTYTPITEENY